MEPFLAQQWRHAYVSAVDDATVHHSAPQEIKAVEVVETRSSAYPRVQPMKAALYFENADGFGDWRIIIGTDATKKLRELANGDKKRCAIVLKKIKYDMCLPLLNKLTVVIDNFRMGTFRMKIRKGSVGPLEFLYLKPRCNGTFALS